MNATADNGPTELSVFTPGLQTHRARARPVTGEAWRGRASTPFATCSVPDPVAVFVPDPDPVSDPELFGGSGSGSGSGTGSRVGTGIGDRLYHPCEPPIPTHAPAHASPNAMGANASANTTATGAAKPNMTSVPTIASPVDNAASSTLSAPLARETR